jgi:hypothetical protein
VNVARMDAGPDGFLIAGNRMTGAAVWRSPDAARFGIVERAPALASDASGETWAFDSTDTTDGWLVAGGFLPKGRIDRDAIGWRSADGAAWQRVPAAGATNAYEELQRVTLLGGVPVAVGLAGQSFGAWRLANGAWQPVGRFGSAPPGAAGTVRALTVAGPRLYAVTGDGTSYALWASGDQGRRWRAAVLPARVTTGPENTVAVAGGAGVAVLLTDDGTVGRTYVAETGA